VELVLPASFTAAAIKYSFLQNEQGAAEVEEANQYAIGSTQFHDMVLHPIFRQRNAGRELLCTAHSAGVVVRCSAVEGTGRNESTAFLCALQHFCRVSAGTVFPYYTREQSATSSSDVVRLRTVCYTDSCYRTQTYQRLLQPDVAFLTLLLSLIAIFHLVKLAHKSVEVVYILHVRVKQRAPRLVLATQHKTHSEKNEAAERLQRGPPCRRTQERCRTLPHMQDR
jgi:hypothetical protein